MQRWLVAMIGLWGGSALAQLTDLAGCTDEFEECKENCSLRFGISTKVESRSKLADCFNKCQGAESLCRDQFIETRNNHLEDDALSKKKKRPDPEPEAVRPDEAPRVSQRVDPPPEKARPASEPEAPRRTATRAAELEPSKPAPAPTAASPILPPSPEATPKRSEAPPKSEPKRSNLDDDVRDDRGSAGHTDASPPAKRTDSKPRPPTASDAQKKKEPDQKKRALDEWDPDAL